MVLKISNVSKNYVTKKRTVKALNGLSLELAKGKCVAVRGPSGCGKSTLLLTAGTLLRPDAGGVFVDDSNVYDINGNARAKFRAEHIGFVFQQFHLVSYLTVMDNVLAASVAMKSNNTRERAAELIEKFGMADRADHVPAELSTGERQRVALARALLNRPGLLLADEPTGNLDSDNAHDVLEYFTEFVKAGGAVLLVTHDERATEYADRCLQMRDGRIVDER